MFSTTVSSYEKYGQRWSLHTTSFRYELFYCVRLQPDFISPEAERHVSVAFGYERHAYGQDFRGYDRNFEFQFLRRFPCRPRGVLIPRYLLNVGSPVSVYRSQRGMCLSFLMRADEWIEKYEEVKAKTNRRNRTIHSTNHSNSKRFLY